MKKIHESNRIYHHSVRNRIMLKRLEASLNLRFNTPIIKIELQMISQPMEVTDVRSYYTEHSEYCLCPNCNRTMDREYQRHCENCGQKLAWSEYNKGHVTIHHVDPNKKGEDSATIACP